MGAALLGSLGCARFAAAHRPPVPTASAAAKPTAPPLAEESHFADLRQLTFGGENAEAYWSFDGTQLTLQSRREMAGCDRIYRMHPADSVPSFTPVSSGKGSDHVLVFPARRSRRDLRVDAPRW